MEQELRPSGPDRGAKKAQKARAVDGGVDPSQWRKVHWITPILNSWQAFAVIFAVVVFQNLDLLAGLAADGLDFGENPLAILLIVLGASVGILLLIILYSYFAWRNTSYAVTDQAVWMRTGILFRNQKHVRLERIQAVDVVHPLLGRIFGLGKLNVDSAGGSGGKLQIGFLKTDDLDLLRAEIMARAAGVFSDADVASVEQTVGDKVLDDSDGYAAAALAEATAPARPVEAPETQLYAIPTGRLLGSIMLSGALIWSLIFLAIGLIGIVVAALAGGGPAVLAALPGALPFIVAAVTFVWSRFAAEFDFRAAVSPDGIRVRRGLLETRSETIPPRRVHAVSVTQPLFWRRFGWYRVRISQASSSSGEDAQKQFASSVLLPVGSRREALLALWLVIPDLGVEDVEAFFDETMHGNGPTPHFIGVPTSAKLFDPLTYRRKGVALTDTCMVVRDGRVQHRASMVTYERIQSQVASQGPWERARGLANVIAATVPGVVTVQIEHLGDADAAEVRDVLTERSKQRRQSEPPERWFSRITGAEASADPSLTAPSEPSAVSEQRDTGSVINQVEADALTEERFRP